RALAVALVGLVPGFITPDDTRADDKAPGVGEMVVGRSAKLPGALLHRGGKDKNWTIVKPSDPIHNEDLIVAVPGGAIDSKNNAVRLTLLADLARLSPYPVLESAVILHENPNADLDFTLDRGRVDITNRKTRGAAHVRVRFHKKFWDITLSAPKSRVALE